jgi:hypothetical protein
LDSNPILLEDSDNNLCRSESILNDLGFSRILDINTIKLSKKEDLNIDIGYIDVHLCRDSIYSINKHILMVTHLMNNKQSIFNFFTTNKNNYLLNK